MDRKVDMLSISPFITVLEEWLSTATEEEASKAYTFSELYSLMRPIAEASSIDWWWGNAAALARHVISMSGKLTEIYGAEFSTSYSRALRKEVHVIKFAKLSDEVL